MAIPKTNSIISRLLNNYIESMSVDNKEADSDRMFAEIVALIDNGTIINHGLDGIKAMSDFLVEYQHYEPIEFIRLQKKLVQISIRAHAAQ
jgi:hypothetical protein